MKSFLFCLLIAGWTICAFAQNSRIIEKTVELSTTEKNASQARRELIEKTSQKVAEDTINEILGDRASKNKRVIQKIVGEYPRYIPFSKIGDLKPIGSGGFSIVCTYKVNVSDLESVLLENGLFYEGDVNPLVIPFVTFTDRVNEISSAWWKMREDPKGSKVSTHLKQIENVLRDKLSEIGFYLMKPMNSNLYNLNWDAISRLDSRLEDRIDFAKSYNAQMIIVGEIEIKAKDNKIFEILMSLSAYQTLNRRLVAEVVRKFDTAPGSYDFVVPKKLEQAYAQVFQDLSNQIFDTWQKGTLGSSVYKLTLKGKLPLLQQEAFKELVRSRALDIKNIRERFMTLSSTIYEFDSTASPKDISTKLNNLELAGFKFVIESANDEAIVLNSLKR
jgi:hypothetical protein